MLLWAIFTLGYFLGVFTALAVFPPWVKEIEEQEMVRQSSPQEDTKAAIETEAIIPKPSSISQRISPIEIQ